MLVVRLQRRGRKKHAQYRIVVQDSHRHPQSGKVVAYLGSYNPHSKVSSFDSAKALEYIQNGAQPSERVVRLLLAEKAKLPKWVKTPYDKRSRSIRNPEKLRRNRPDEPAEEAPAEAPVAEEPVEAPDAEKANEAPAEEKSEEKPAETDTDDVTKTSDEK